MDVGKEVKRLRKMNNLSARKAADLLGINQWRITSWEGKGTSPNDEDRGILEHYFGVHITDLDKLTNFKFTKKEPKKIEETKELPRNAPDLSNDTIRDLARTGIILAEANKFLSDANNKLAENNRMVIDMHKLNLDNHSGTALISRYAAEILSEFLATKYSLPQNDVLKELGKLIYAHSEATLLKSRQSSDQT